MSAARALLSGIAVCLLAGCGKPEYIELKPDTLVLRVRNDSIWMQARAISHTGVQYPKTRVYWKIKDPTVAAVDETGRVTPLKSGLTEVVGSAGQVTAAAPVEVLFAEKMTVSPNPLVLTEGSGSVDVQVKVFDYRVRELRDRTATFKSMNKEVLSMGQNAAFPVAAGTTQLQIQVEQLVQTIEVKVEGAKTARNK